jgi:hypothetical protein
MIAQIIEGKLPTGVLTKFYEEKKSEAPWAVKDLRKQLGNLVLLREKIGRINAEHSAHAAKDDRAKNNRSPKRPERSQNKPKTENHISSALPVIEKKKPEAKKYGCYFCGKNGHAYFRCTEYSNVNDRWNRAKEMNLCFKCLHSDHRTQECKKDGECYHCGKSEHNSSLCNRRGDRRESEKPNQGRSKDGSRGGGSQKQWTASAPASSGSRSTQGSLSNAVVEESPERKNDSGTSAAVAKTSASSEKHHVILLMAKKTSVFNPTDPDKSTEVVVFMDNGSCQTFINNKTTSVLSLEGENSDRKISVSTFGGGGKQFPSKKVSVGFHLKNGRTKADASMNLREFISNDTVFNDFVETQEGKSVSQAVKVLGIRWNTRDDTLSLSLQKIEVFNSVSKRQVLQLIAKVFDPLGLIAPLLVPAKAFFQSLWKKPYGWDSMLSEEDLKQWQSITETWGTTLTFPRRISSISSANPDAVYELHCFVDASAVAYAAAAYLKTTVNGSSEVALLMTKNRLNPSKQITIPRLELLAVVIGVRLAKYVRREMKLFSDKVTIWTDSSCVLTLIGTKKEQPRFVANRLREIREHRDFDFRHVPTKDNPADFSSRGMSPEEFAETTIWWSGPKWLLQSSENWPRIVELSKVTFVENDFDGQDSAENEVVLALIPTTAELPQTLIDHNRFNKFTKFQGVLAYVLRFIKLKVLNKLVTVPATLEAISSVSISGPITANDYKVAESVLIRDAQHCCQPSEKERSQLRLFEDALGILRCSGRLGESEMSRDAVEPIFLPRDSRLTTLLILRSHEKMLHSGISATLGEVRQTYWIPKPRGKVRHVIARECFHCRRFSSNPYSLPDMPQLPAERVVRSRTFENTGLDYLGPITVRNNGEISKCWGSLFTCFTTRNIHLEVVQDMSAIAFLNAFRRFVARRGRPRQILSDNASQFVLAAQTLKNAFNMASKFAVIIRDDTVQSYCATEKIEWIFTTERAPWKGGLYEKMVDLVKKSFRHAVGRKCLSVEQLSTIFCEIEAIVNSRPLTYIDETATPLEILRPIDFLLPDGKLGMPVWGSDHGDPDYRPGKLDSRETLLAHLKSSLSCLDRFWQLWSKDYLLSLRERHRFSHAGSRLQSHFTPKEGEIVLLQEDALPRGQWRLAKIATLKTSSDGQIRSAKICLPNQRELNRPINQLFPLEINDEKQVVPESNITATAAQILLGEAPSRRIGQQSISKKVFFLTIFGLLLLPQVVFGKRCQTSENFTRVYSQGCISEGMMIMQDAKGFLCHLHASCKNGHIKPIEVAEKNHFRFYSESTTSQHCGELCPCPDWASECSFYDGPKKTRSTSENAQGVLEVDTPEVCSFTPMATCAREPLIGPFAQIQLFDGSKHLVKSLQLLRTQVNAEDFECIGEGIIVGSTAYCDIHKCAEEGTKYCFYPNYEQIYFVSSTGKVLIKSWGTVTTTYYGFRKDDQVTSCLFCSIACKQGGVDVLAKTSIDRAEICTTRHCYHITKLKSIESVLFPHEVSLFEHKVEARFWKTGELVLNTSKVCPANPFCQLIDCTFCIEYLKNPQCATRGATILLGLALIGAIVICCLLAGLMCAFNGIITLVKCLRWCVCLPFKILRILWRTIRSKCCSILLQSRTSTKPEWATTIRSFNEPCSSIWDRDAYAEPLSCSA